MRAIACRASAARQGTAPLCIKTAPCDRATPRRRCCTLPRCTLRLHLRRSHRPPRCSPGASPDKVQPADDGAEEALGRAMLLGVAAAYGSLTVACRYVFLLPGTPVRTSVPVLPACVLVVPTLPPQLLTALLTPAAPPRQAPSVMSAVRGVVAALCFLPLLAKERGELASEPPFFWRAAAELTAYNALYEGLLNLSVVHTDATRAGFLFESSVLFTPALATLTGARVAPTTWAAAAAAVCGATSATARACLAPYSPLTPPRRRCAARGGQRRGCRADAHRRRRRGAGRGARVLVLRAAHERLRRLWAVHRPDPGREVHLDGRGVPRLGGR